jgi:hypothetical protein
MDELRIYTDNPGEAEIAVLACGTHSTVENCSIPEDRGQSLKLRSLLAGTAPSEVAES